MSAADVLPKLGAKGIIAAGGLHGAIKGRSLLLVHLRLIHYSNELQINISA
jgi:hypothetical protein